MQLVFMVVGGMTILGIGFAMMPALPPVPPELIAFQNGFNDILLNAIQFLRYFFSPMLMWLALGVIITVFLAEPIYHAVMWVLRKIPVLNIK